MIGVALCQPDRWTCPTCHVTETFDDYGPEGLQASIRDAQLAHAADHKAEREELAAKARERHEDAMRQEAEVRLAGLREPRPTVKAGLSAKRVV